MVKVMTLVVAVIMVICLGSVGQGRSHSTQIQQPCPSRCPVIDDDTSKMKRLCDEECPYMTPDGECPSSCQKTWNHAYINGDYIHKCANGHEWIYRPGPPPG